jgi:APA family basic amino acid/polyamine antiporter
MALRRTLTAVDATWLVAGSMVGAGIFAFPGLVAGQLPGLVLPLAAWAFGGVLALCGALVYGELGARMPHAGGDYRYLTDVFGPGWGFLSGWAAFTVTFSAAVAAMALVAVDYLLRALALPWEGVLSGRRIYALLLVLALTAANVVGARVSGRLTALLTGLPVAGLLTIYGYGLLVGRGTEVAAVAEPVARSWTWPGFGSAMVLVFFTYTGWNAAAYVAGEIRDPGRNLTRALVAGTALVTALYLGVNAVLLAVVPPARMAGSTTAGAEAARILLGEPGGRALSAVIALAVAGTANVTLMAGSRIWFAMAGDGLAPAPLRRVNAQGVPGAALWCGGVWAALLTLPGDVQALVNWTTLAILLLSSLTVVSLFVVRRRAGPSREFRCPGYPFTPLLYLVASLAVAASSARHDPLEAAKGLLLVGAGVPIYLLLRRRAAAAQRADGAAAPAAAAPPASTRDSPR